MTKETATAEYTVYDIENGVVDNFGYWRVTDPTIVRLNSAKDDDSEKQPRYAWVKCRCTACGKTEKLVRVTYLLNGRSSSCCLRGLKHRTALDDWG